MTSLTQIDLSYLEEASSDVTKTIVAYHRLHRIAAVYFLGQNQFDFFECKSIFELKWQKLGSWRADDEFKSILGVLALESYDVFALIGSTNNGTDIILVGFDGKVRLKQTISQRKDITCFDYNQKTRDFFIGYENGSLMCVYTNCSAKFEYSLTVKRVIKVHSEKSQAPKQLLTQDFMGLLFILTNEGNILCIDGTKFELVYSISRNAFSLIPSRIYCDKFGTDFLVRLKNAEKSKEQLECWHPPEDYASCRAGRFERFVIPLTAPIVSLSFESVGLYSGRTLLEIFTLNKRLQLWSCFGSTSVNLESEITLNIPSGIWKQYLAMFGSDILQQISPNTVKDPLFGNLDHYNTISTHVSSLNENLKFSSVLLTNICQLSTAIGIHLPDKKDTELNMQYIDTEISKYGVPIDQAQDLSQFHQEPLPIPRQFTYNSDDESSIMSETLIGALSNLAEVNRSIDERISQSQSLNYENHTHNDSLSSVQLTNEVTFEDTISVAPQYPNLHDVTLSGIRRDSAVPSAPLSSRDFPSLLAYPQAGVAPPSQPDFSSRKLSAKPSNLSDLVLSDYKSSQAKPAAYRELEVIKFFPTFFLHNQDTSKCDPNSCGPYSMVRFLEPDGMLLNDFYRLFSFTHEGLYPLTDVLEKKLAIKFHSTTFRSGFLTVISDQKDCLVYNMKTFNVLPTMSISVPLRVVLTIKNHVKVTAVVSADVFLRNPPLPNGHTSSGGTLRKKDKTAPESKDRLKFSEPEFSKYMIIAVGDSDGYIHIYISDSNQTVLQTESFLAHQSVSIKQILFTGDATRSLWQVGIDYLPGSNKLVLQTLGGSSIITASSEGEVKVWQPFSMEMNTQSGQTGSKNGSAMTISSSLEKFFHYHQVRWKLSGVFVINRTYSVQHYSTHASKTQTQSNTSTNSRNPSKPPTATGLLSKKLREMVSMALLPSCLNILVSFTNGTIEEWNIPGLLDTNEASLATSQKEIWCNIQSHYEDVISMRVYVHGPLSTIKHVHLLHDHERDSTLAKLATFVRIPNRMKTTIGLTFQEMKLLASSSSLTTCSKDSSVVLWGFHSAFFGHCSYLVPVPVRKFYFSTCPTQGLCYAINITNGQYHSGNVNWKVDAIINGKVQTVVLATRDSLFGSLPTSNAVSSNLIGGKAAEMLTDYRADYGNRKAFIHFEDELLDPFGSKDDICLDEEKDELKNRMIMGMPVVTPVFKAQYLVNGYQMYNTIFDPFRLGVTPSADQNIHDFSGPTIKNPNLLSANLLEEWGKVEAPPHDPVVSTVHVTDRPPTAVKSSVREMDFNIIPEFIESSHRNYEEYLADISSRPRSNLSSRDNALSKTRSLSPVIIKVPSFDRLENLQESIELEGNKESEMTGRKKVLVQGIMVEVESNIDLKEFEQSILNQKFVLERTPPRSPEKPTLPPSRKAETRPLKESQNGLPTDEGKLQSRASPKKLSETKKSEIEEDGDAKSAASERTRLSIAAVSFSKDSKVVRTISFDADEVVADSYTPSKYRTDDEASVASDITQDEPKKPHKGLVLNKTMELRQRMQEQLKERLELREKRGSNIYGGDARQSLKKAYTSKTSLQKQDLQHIQKGAKQPTSNAAINNLPPSRVIIQRPGIRGNSQSPTKLQEEEDLKRGRQPLPAPTKFVVVKQKDDTSKKLTHQLIVAKTKYYKERSSKGENESDGSLSGNGVFYESDENIGAANSNNRIEFEDESNSQLDLDSTGFSLSIDTNIRLEDGFKRDKDYDSPSRRSPLAISENNTVKSPTLAAMNIPAVLAKTQSLELDLPDLRKDKRRKYALAISQNMSLRNSEKADELANVIAKTALFDEENDDLDDISIVTHYFDRNAKPIFVDRGKPPKQVLKKRKQKTGKGMGSRSRSEDEEDGEWIEDENAIQEMNAALLDMYLDELSPDEKKMFENLDEEAKQKLLRELRMQMGTGKRKNNKTKDLFKKLTKMATEQARVHAILSMELNLETTEVTDETLSISITSNQKGPVVVVLAYTKYRFTPTKEDFFSSSSILNLPGYLEHRSIVLDRDNFEGVTFCNLRPETSYTIFAAVDKSNHVHFPMTDEVNEDEEEEKNKLIKPPKSINLKSLEEKLEIEWNRLDLEERTIELRAAIRSEFVQMKSFYNYPVIFLPTDEEILESNFQNLISPIISDNDYHTLKSQRFQSNSSLKHIPMFLDWWIGHSKVTSKVRSSFHEIEAFYAILNKKVQKSVEEDRLFSNPRELNVVIEFSKSNIKHRARLNREIDPADNLLLAGIPEINAESTDLSDDRQILFKRFRSWYKGGFVIKEKEMKLSRLKSGSGSTRSAISPLPSPQPASASSRRASFTSLSKSRSSDSKDNLLNAALTPDNPQLAENDLTILISTAQKKRLQERTIFLRSLLEPVDVCTRQIQKLYEQYDLVKSMAFRLNELSTSRRNSITSKDAKAIMSARKFLDLCIARQMLTKNIFKNEEEPFPDIYLNTLNPFQALKRTKSEAAVTITPKTSHKTFPIPMVIQRIAGVDLFRSVHVNTLKPDEPPPLALKCLPGTTRRPNKPWQSLSKQEQELEITLACSLDSIWELAVLDNVPVPNPEDRLLPSTEFPLKTLIWENFRKWYAGEEEIDPIPGQGVPTVARVIFSEQLEMPQVERDSFVAEMMEEQAFQLPLSYYSKNRVAPSENNRRENELDDEVKANSFDLDERDLDESNLIEVVLSSSKTCVQSMRQAYEKAISSAAGAQIRNDLMVELLSHYLHSRLMNMMKYLWPPGLKRIGLQYIYPRSLSFYYPKFSLPLHRFHLFPSRSRVTYNREEILNWYNVLEMQEDDQLMIRAEKKGVKQRSYHEWLTLEPQRQIYSRTQMAIEDSIAYQHRELHLLLEKRWKYQEDRLKQLDEDIDTGEYNPVNRTRTKTSMLNLTPREMRLAKLNQENNLAEEDERTEIRSENDENESNIDNLSLEGTEKKEMEAENKKTEKDFRERKLDSRGSVRGETTFSSPFSSPRYPTKSPRLINITPRTEMSREYSEIAFPATESTTHEPVSAIPPAVQSFLSPELLDRQTEEFKAYISQHLSSIEQDELSTALAMFDRSRGIGGLQTTPINEELAANFINANQMNFRVLSNLPQEYWYIFEESFEFKNGSGIYNDDEVEAERVLQEERARKAIDDALEFQRILEFEKKKREQEELARLRREEQDRRLREGMVRRRKLREHLEELKQQRIQKRKEEEEARLKAIEEERLAKLEEERQIAMEKYLKYLEEERVREISLMEAEEVYMKDLKVRHRELKYMEHEDILSFLVEQMNVQYEMAEKERIKELEELYTPFEPYQFKQSRLPALERVLTYADDVNYDEARSLEEDEEYLHSLDGGKSSSSLVTSPSEKRAFTSNFSPGREKNEKLLARMPPTALPFSNTQLSVDYNSPTKTKKKQFNSLPMPTTHDPSIISFQSIVKQDHPTTMNQKMNHMKNTAVKTSDHQPTKKKIRKFFDITKLSVDNLSKPLNASINIDNTKHSIQRTDGDLLAPKSNTPIVSAHSPTKTKDQPEEVVMKPPILPFNPYDTQWELQKTPPLTLSNLPFFIRPSSHGLNPFRSHSEQALSSTNLILPSSSHSRSRPFSATSPGIRPKSTSNRGFGSSSKPNSSTGMRLLSPIDITSLQNPDVAIPVSRSLAGEDNKLPSVGSRSSYSPMSLEREKDRESKSNLHVQIAIKEELTPTHEPGSSPTSGRQRPIVDDSDLASHHTKQTMETYESEYNKTTEVTVDYINSLLAETKVKSEQEHEILAHYSEDELQFIQSLESSKSLHLGSKAYHQHSMFGGDGLSAPSLSLEKQMVGASLGETSNKKSKLAKNVVSLVPQMVEKTNSQKEWLEYLSLQQKLTTASLSTIDTQEKEKLKKIIGRGGVLPISAQLANETIKLPSKQRSNIKPAKSNKKAKELAAEILSSTMPNLSSSSPSKRTGLSTSASTSAIKFQNSAIGLDYKTFQLAQTASEEVIRLKEQKELLKQYISGHAMLEEEQNEYYLLACQPGIQSQTILQKNPSIQKFAKEIDDFLKNADHAQAVSGAVTAMNTAESIAGSDDEENSLTTAGGDAGGMSNDNKEGKNEEDDEEEVDDNRVRSNATSPTSLNSRKKKSKSLFYQPTSVGISSIPPPLVKKPFLSTSTSKLLTQVVPSTLTAHVTPLLSRKDPVPVQKKRPHPLTQINSAEEAREIEEAALLTATSALNPFVMGNKITIAKESKKDILAKSKQLLISSNNHKNSTHTLPPKPVIRAFVKPNITVNTSTDDSSSVNNKSASTPQSGMYESSLELKTGRSLDLFIRTPRVDGKSLELENHHTSDSHDDGGLVGTVELERSASDLSSFHHHLLEEETSK